MKLTFKTMTAILMAATMVLGSAGCAPKGGETTPTAKTETKTETKTDTASAEKVTLNVWHQWANDTNELKAIYDAAVTGYMEENPNVTINSQTLDTAAYKTKISTEFAGKASGIDVFYYWGAGTAQKLVDADKLLPLDEYITEEVKANVRPGTTNAFEFGGNTYSLPTFSWYMALYCNEELFDKAGATVPTTYAELLTAVEKLSTLEGITPFVGGAKDGWNAGFIYEALALREVGAENINKMLKGEANFDDPGYKVAAEKLMELYKVGAFGKNPLETPHPDADAAFIGGTAAMRLMGSWYANGIETDPASMVKGKVKVVKIPVIEGKGNETDFAGGFIESFWVNKNTNHVEEAAKFAIYINEAMGKGAHETGTGFTGWTTPVDDSNLSPLFVEISKLVNEGEAAVLAWDTALDANTASIHLEQVQSLFTASGDPEAFVQAHKDAINK